MKSSANEVAIEYFVNTLLPRLLDGKEGVKHERVLVFAHTELEFARLQEELQARGYTDATFSRAALNVARVRRREYGLSARRGDARRR